jgi:hypothetical protein
MNHIFMSTTKYEWLINYRFEIYVS